MCCHPKLILPLKLGALDASSANIQVKPSPWHVHVPHAQFLIHFSFLQQTLRRHFYLKISISAQHCKTSMTKNDKEDTRAFFWRNRLKEYFSWKDSSEDNADDPPQPMHIEVHKLYRPNSILKSAPGTCGTLESYIDAVEWRHWEAPYQPKKSSSTIWRKEKKLH